jgi:hypothetical protein
MRKHLCIRWSLERNPRNSLCSLRATLAVWLIDALWHQFKEKDPLSY